MPQGHQKPANRILCEMIAGKIKEYEVGANATIGECIPGSLVINDTYEHAIKESGAKADNFVGVVECAPDQAIGATKAIGETALVLTGHFICQVRLKASENVAIGDTLVTGADGLAVELAVAAIGGQGCTIGKALEASNVTTIAYILAEIWTNTAEAAAAS